MSIGRAAYGVKQFVARVKNSRGIRFNVFETGDSRYYLFDPIDQHDCSYCMAFPVLKKDLRPDIRRALRHGWGNTL